MSNPTPSSTTANDTTTSRALVRLSTVTLDMTDALELSELLDYLAQWLQHTDAHVRADLAAYAWDDRALPQVRQRLAAFARLLVCGHASFDLDDLGLEQDDLDHDDGADARRGARDGAGEQEPAW